jgi:chromatin remodeling complex protein RSC6
MTTSKKSSAASASAAPATVAAPAQKAASKKATKEQTTVVAAAPAPVEKAKKAPSKKVEEKPVATNEAAPVEEEKKGRRKVTKDSVFADASALLEKIQEEITKRAPVATEGESAEASKKPKRKKDTGVPLKFIRHINKKLEVLRNDMAKMLKIKSTKQRDNSKSGLMKPVNISAALFNFLKNAGVQGVAKDGKYARVEITKHIHKYVKDNNLRNKDDLRILLPDTPLAKLLGYDVSQSASNPLTYFKLPQFMKQHFISDAPAVVAK